MENSKIRVSCVSYLNSLPFLYGLQNHKISNEIIIELDHPSDCAKKVESGKADIGLIPVAAIPRIQNHEILTDYCIGTNGSVDSVLLLSNVPVNQIESIILDYQSVTSVRLVQLLCDRYWKIHPVFCQSAPGFIRNISGTTAAVVIGDRAMNERSNYPFVYDLGNSWYTFTGLPFVFACWVSNKKMNDKFKTGFNDALKLGISSIDKVSNMVSATGKYNFDVRHYLTERLNFNLTDELKKGMEYFMELSEKYDMPAIDR